MCVCVLNMSLRSYVVVEKVGNNTFKSTDRIFKNRQPRAAALKAASRGIKDIYLRETRIPERIHHFKGSFTMVDAPEIMQKRGGGSKIKKPNVKKIGIIML